MIFLSWSGEFSLNVADIFSTWFKVFFPKDVTFLSRDSIGIGEHWNDKLEKAILDSKYGIVIITKDNMNSTWMTFEAGMLYRSCGIAPVCVGFDPKELTGPLSGLQAKPYCKNTIKELLKVVNSRIEEPVDNESLLDNFERFWPMMDSAITGEINRNSFTSDPKQEYDVVNNREYIEKILECACRSVKFPDKEYRIRAVVAKCDYAGETRTTVYSYNARIDAEKVATLPLYFGVIGNCLRGNRVVYEQLPVNHIETYPTDVKNKITEELCAVIAAPIFGFGKDANKSVAVLAFDLLRDSDGDIHELCEKFHNREMLDIIQTWADILSHLLRFNL